MKVALGCALALALLTAALAAPRAHAAPRPPLVGIGEQYAEIFNDPSFKALGIRDVRVVTAWDALDSDWQADELDTYMEAAHKAGVRVLFSFGHSRDPTLAHMLPSVKQFTRAFKAFRVRYPWVKDYVTWNEANHCSQPTCHNPARAAAYYKVVKANCPGCRVVAADVLDDSEMVHWLTAFKKAAGNGKMIWGLHNYIDANRFRTSGTRALLRSTKGDVWFTETGGLVMRKNGSTIAFPGSIDHAAKATSWVFKLAALSPRVKRVYFYQWMPAPTPDPTWDSALMNKYDKPRPAYLVLLSWLRRHGISG